MKSGVHAYVNPLVHTQNPFPAIAAGMGGLPQTLTAAGALSLDTENHDIQITGGSDVAFTLATTGAFAFQKKTIVLSGKGGAGNAVLTVTGGGIQPGGAALATVTFNTDGDYVTLQFLNGKWCVVVNSGCTLA